MPDYLPAVFCRAANTVQGTVYVVQGFALYRVSPTGAVVRLGDVAGGPDTSISGNNGKVTVVSGGNYYVWDPVAQTLTEPAPGAFSDFGDVTFFGQLTVLTERGGRRVQWSNVADPDTLDGLSFATTEARDDNILRVMPVAGALWFFKETSIEPWYQAGSDLAAVPGATIDRGLKARNLLCRVPGGAFFVGDDGSAYLASGGIERVSNVAVETSLKYADPQRCFYFEDEGHKFCVIQFDDRQAWVYNIATGEWCERGEGNDIGPWSAQTCVERNNEFYVITSTGTIARLTRNNADVGGVMVRRIVSRTAFADGARFNVPRMQVRARVGQYQDAPLVTLRMSDDFGETWRVRRVVSLGERGEHLTRLMFRRLGQYRQSTMELTVSDPVDVTFSAVVTA